MMSPLIMKMKNWRNHLMIYKELHEKLTLHHTPSINECASPNYESQDKGQLFA